MMYLNLFLRLCLLWAIISTCSVTRVSVEQMSAKTSGNSIMDNMSCLGHLAEFLVRAEFLIELVAWE